MSDSTLNAFVAQGTDAERIAFTPVPPTPAAGPDSGYYFFVNDTTPQKLYAWDSAGSAWVLVSSGGAGTIPATVQGDLLYASASNVLSALAKDANATRYLSNTGGSNNPAWAQVNLANGVTGDLPFANLTQGSALSVLGVTGNATADNASIAAASDFQVMRRSGTAVAFGSVNLASSNAVTGILPVANGGTGSASGGAILLATGSLTNAQIQNLPTTPIQLIAAPGAGFRLNFIQATLNAKFATAAYTGASTTLSYISLVDGAQNPVSNYIGNDSGTSPVMDYLTTFLNNTQKVVPLVPWTYDADPADGWGNVAVVTSALTNENLNLAIIAENGAVNFGGGNVANTLDWRVLYTVDPV